MTETIHLPATEPFAFVFPGQGSQYIGMLKEVLSAKIVVKTFQSASQLLDKDLLALAEEGPATTLNSTQWTQPILLAADVAIWRLWREYKGQLPKCLAGHSLGEYAALVCAEAMSFEDAIKIVHLRGRLMQDATPPQNGAMSAILGLDDETVSKICQEFSQTHPGQIVEAANFNTPGQVVIAGHKRAVNDASEQLMAHGARRIITLPVSVPAHCSLMKPAAESLAQVLSTIDIASPKITVIQNISQASTTEPDQIRSNLVKQLYSPVPWTKIIQGIKAQGISTIFECGPGKVLTGLIKKTDKSIHTCPLNTLNSLKNAIMALGKTGK